MHRTLTRTDLPTAVLILGLAAVAAGIGYFSREALLAMPVAVGLGFSTHASIRLWHIYGSRHWPETTGRLVAGTLAFHDVSLGVSRSRYWFPQVEYGYTWQGNEYASQRLSVDLKSIWSSDQEYAEILLDRLRKARLNVYVNPRRPGFAVLFYGATPERIAHYWAMALGGTLISASAILVFMLLQN